MEHTHDIIKLYIIAIGVFAIAMLIPFFVYLRGVGKKYTLGGFNLRRKI